MLLQPRNLIAHFCLCMSSDHDHKHICDVCNIYEVMINLAVMGNGSLHRWTVLPQSCCCNFSVIYHSVEFEYDWKCLVNNDSGWIADSNTNSGNVCCQNMISTQGIFLSFCTNLFVPLPPAAEFCSCHNFWTTCQIILFYNGLKNLTYRLPD